MSRRLAQIQLSLDLQVHRWAPSSFLSASVTAEVASAAFALASAALGSVDSTVIQICFVVLPVEEEKGELTERKNPQRPKKPLTCKQPRGSPPTGRSQAVESIGVWRARDLLPEIEREEEVEGVLL